MIDKDAHKLLALFADAQPHGFFEVATLGKVLLKKPERKVEQVFRRHLLDNAWVRRCWKSWDPRLDMYEITTKGDEFFRAIQIWRITRGKYTEDMIRHFRLFNRKLTGKYGVEGMGEHISELEAGLKESHPHLYE